VSNHHTISCLDCDPEGYCEMESIHDANWEHEGFVWVLKNRQTLINLDNMDVAWPVEINIRAHGLPMDTSFLDEHNDHKLVVRDEYRNFYYDEEGVKHAWSGVKT
jgi:hypothetical protein